MTITDFRCTGRVSAAHFAALVFFVLFLPLRTVLFELKLGVSFHNISVDIR